MSGYTYILFNKKNGTLYVGATSDLVKRINEHKEKIAEGFTKRYNVTKLGYYESYDSFEEALIREKKLKGASRSKKLELIEIMNPMWDDLYYDIID